MAKYELNVAIKQGKDWTGKGDKFVHFMLVQLGDDLSIAAERAEVVMQKFGTEEFKFSFRTVKTETTIEELN